MAVERSVLAKDDDDKTRALGPNQAAGAMAQATDPDQLKPGTVAGVKSAIE